MNLPLCCTLLPSPPGVLHQALGSQVHARPTGACPEEGNKGDQRMEQIFYKDRLRDVGLFSLENRRYQGECVALSSTCQGPMRELERGFLQGCAVIGQEGMALG